MTRERVRRTFTLSDAANRLLDAVGNYSQYIDALIVQHGREWTDALAVLGTHGWQSAEMWAACEALGGYGISGPARTGEFLADELAAAQERDNFFAKYEVPHPRRQRCLKQLREQPAVAHALSAVIREYWLPNEACRAAVQRHR
jgi:hypothetical protein